MFFYYFLIGVVIYLVFYSKKDQEKILRTKQKTVRILKYITRIIQASDKQNGKDNK